MIKKFWNRFGVYAGILGLVVDCITLWGIIRQSLSIDKLDNLFFTSFPIPNIPLFIDYYKLGLIITAAILVTCYLILIIFSPRNGFSHLCDNITGEPYTNKYGETEDNPFIAAFKFGVFRQKQHIGVYSFLVNFIVISPILLLWLRAFFMVPSDSYIFVVSFITLILAAFSTLYLPKLARKPENRVGVWGIYVSDVLIIVIAAYGLTNWGFAYSLYVSSLIVLAAILFALLVKMLRNKLILFTLTYDGTVSLETQVEFLKWLSDKNSGE